MKTVNASSRRDERRRKFLVLFEFYKSSLIPNICLSLIGLLNSSATFLAFFGTIGLLASFLFKESFRKNEYYFYYNIGFPKYKLYLFCFAVNLILASLLAILFL